MTGPTTDSNLNEEKPPQQHTLVHRTRHRQWHRYLTVYVYIPPGGRAKLTVHGTKNVPLQRGYIYTKRERGGPHDYGTNGFIFLASLFFFFLTSRSLDAVRSHERHEPENLSESMLNVSYDSWLESAMSFIMYLVVAMCKRSFDSKKVCHHYHSADSAGLRFVLHTHVPIVRTYSIFCHPGFKYKSSIV